ncbi:MAG: hypothetical protein FP825_01590 [Hyphomonas sp.]|uniref:TylF/MycF/NovP-related O-methyltransferase n=1 Tax=Hyphomonas sp. TaxID=87 RepID=UPI0017D5FEB6|nr:TylF/MycF/NovP-related O-methyltransferase [Hyphomonas sp.]MBA3067157.1 hypothetical protein [Hyphomonas sp.]MBU3920100.1 TylF/MycF family methyltransferase [Alphaproteobacteria bacterium]MBU4061233.1 TylF/MycF family methyltransferase [Alphaproteobacteria bacterium]MBU4165145.1 TylF/MycF family methyltransferase [Alphaproteobacteria bacterium]
MKQAIKSALESVGLLEPALKIRRQMSAMGLLPWTPLVPEDAFTDCAINAIQTLQGHGHAFGDYLEFGVSRGTSMACMHKALQTCGVKTRLIGFDSFEGLGADAEESGWKAGDFASTEAATRRYLASKGVPDEDVVLVKGWFSNTATPETCARLGITKASLLMIDADTYDSSREGLAFGVSLLADELVVLFDDWGWSVKNGKRGQKEAFAEVVEANPGIRFSALPAYREEARVFLLTRI